MIRTGRVEDQVRDERRPAGLVGCSEPGAVVAVEVLVEGEVVPPGRIRLQRLDPAEERPAAVGPGQPDRDEPVGEVLGDLPAR